jgi:signal transduction histidine kinase
MFASIGRRLAILNVAVVLSVIALVGAGIYFLLRESLAREAETALQERIAIAAVVWESRLESAEPLESSANPPRSTEDQEDDDDEGESDDESDDDSYEILESGDILLFVFDAQGRLVGNERRVNVDGVPDMRAVERALEGEVDSRTVMVDEEEIRIRTEPVREHGDILGVIQATRSEQQHNEELRLVRLASLVGIGIGTLIALPAGLYLARRAMQPIDAAFSRQRAFVADASHELRTPLTVLRANAEMIQRLPDPSSEEIHREMTAMLEEIDHMTTIVNDLLMLARYSDEPTDLAVERVDVAKTIKRAVHAFRSQAEVAGVTISAEVTGSVVAMANAALVEQVVRILIDNAVKYTTPGDSIEVSAVARERTVEISVRDHGPGIDPADQPFVFDRFFRADRGRSRHTSGTGLGLPIARAVVQALGGTIMLESSIGLGTAVHISLPAASQ